MSSLVDILCSEQHVSPAVSEPPAPPPATADSESAASDETSKSSALGQPPFPLGATRRKSGWGKRFKEREQGRLAIIFPRRKMGEAARGSDAVWLSVDVLNSLSDRSLASAAKLLGISATALKKACRELGVERWPYCRKRQADAAGGSTDEESRADTARSYSPVPSVSSTGATSPSDMGNKCEMAAPTDLMDLLHRNAIMVLEAAKKLDGNSTA